MLMALPVAPAADGGNLNETDAALDSALLNQAGLLASLIAESRTNGSDRLLGDAELMRIVKSQQTMLSAGAERAVDQIAKQVITSPLCAASSKRWRPSKRKGRLAIALGIAIGAAAALHRLFTRD